MEFLERSRPVPGVEVLRLNRPDARNALHTPSLVELLEVLRAVSADPEVRVLVLSTTSTVAFCAGADVGEKLDHDGGVRRMELFCDLYREFEALPMPTVCVCVGNVLGAGTEIAATCDLRVGGDNLKLGWVAGRLGVPVGPARLVPLVGVARAKDLAFTTRVIGADEAASLGLVSEVVPAAEAEAAAVALAARVAENRGIRQLKQIFRGLEETQDRVEFENELLMRFQREEGGLPAG
ncbi:MAG: enoyl-CoA hydratase/isomerase family protein [Solirubrobacteraceae bacterium]|nr:enoyl-CoA hydratase/isomerase family protein [Solirubrobacteraceae bacterium]